MIIRLTKKILNIIKLKKTPIKYAKSIGVNIGDNCRLIDITSSTFGSESYLITIGNHVTITSGVRFITHDGGVWVMRNDYKDIDVIAPIKIGNNCFIGLNSIILPGVTIGDNCVIGAGSIVTKDIPPDTVAAGTPARKLTSINEYKVKSLSNALFIRSMPPKEKKKY